MECNYINFMRDGRIHRFHVRGDKVGSLNGWYIAKSNGWVVYSTWKEGAARYYINEKGDFLSQEETKNFRKQLQIDQNFIRLKQDERAELLPKILKNTNLETHPYLEKKGFPNYKAPVYNETLLISVNDISRKYSEPISIQSIYKDGRKKFFTGCRTKGGIHVIAPESNLEEKVILLCEGYATGLTLSVVTNKLIAVCFYASNLSHCTDLLHTRFPDFKLIICADNDINTQGNPGVKEASKAGDKYNIPIIIPDLSKCPKHATDFNDLMLHVSLDEVKEQLSLEQY